MSQESAVRAPAKSFIIRVWEDGDTAQVRGEVEHLGTGEKRFFANFASLEQVIALWRRDEQETLVPR